MKSKTLRVIARGEAWRPLYKTVREDNSNLQIPHTITRSVEIGIERGSVELLIDADRLIDALGHRALKSKRGQSLLKDGLIVCRVIERRRTYKAGEEPKP